MGHGVFAPKNPGQKPIVPNTLSIKLREVLDKEEVEAERPEIQ